MLYYNDKLINDDKDIFYLARSSWTKNQH